MRRADVEVQAGLLQGHGKRLVFRAVPRCHAIRRGQAAQVVAAAGRFEAHAVADFGVNKGRLEHHGGAVAADIEHAHHVFGGAGGQAQAEACGQR
ncbi:hypothetical protein D3C85_1603750 [compost metagenome]